MKSGSIRTFTIVTLAGGLLAAGTALACELHEGKKIKLTVTENGFEPASVKVEKGKPVELVITRKTDKTCAKEIVVPGYDIEKKLPLDKPVEVAFTPKKSGEIKYGCGMGQMIGGVLVVE